MRRAVSPTLNVETNAGKAETDGMEFEFETKPWECLVILKRHIHS